MACPVAGMSLCRTNSICSEEGNKRHVIPAQNKSVQCFLWNDTFYRLEMVSLVAEATKERNPHVPYSLTPIK